MTTAKMTTTKWVLDTTHSEVQFKIKHLLISTVTGQFNKFEGTIETEEDDFTTAKAHFAADVNSISTNNEQRDAHLKSGDFFDAENYPQLTFEAEKTEKVDDENYRIYGTFTLRGISKKIILNGEFGGSIQDPWGNTRVGFSVNGKINRKDFGVNFGLVTETGGVALANEVKILVNAQFVKQKVEEPVTV